jgi:hypothetical protein
LTAPGYPSVVNLLQLQKQLKEVVSENFEFRGTRNGTRVITRSTADFQSIKSNFDSQNLSYPCGRGSNNSTVTLRVVEGDEKGSLKSETVKYGHESKGIRTRKRLRWLGPAAYTKDRPILSLERASHKNKTVTVKE